MKKYEHLRKRAREWRQQGIALTEICKRMSLGRSTIHYWIKDIPIDVSRASGDKRTEAQIKGQQKGSRANSICAQKKREEAYSEAFQNAELLLKEKDLRDFIVLYSAEGYRRNRNVVNFVNSNPVMVKMCYNVMKRIANKERPFRFYLQCHIDNDDKKLKSFWAELLSVPSDEIRIIRRSNSGELSGRKWRSTLGVLSVVVHDTYFRSKIQALMDYVEREWKEFEYDLRLKKK